MTKLQQQRQAYLFWLKQRGLVWPMMTEVASKDVGKTTFALRGTGSRCPRVVFLAPLTTIEAPLFKSEERALLIRMVRAMKVAFSEIYVCGICYEEPRVSSRSTEIEVGYDHAKLKRHIDQLNPKAVVIFQQDLVPECDFICPVVRTWHPAELLASTEKKRETWHQLQTLLSL